MTTIMPHIKPFVAFTCSSDDRVNFTEGDCWMLAHAIHDITGWDVVAVGMREDFEEVILFEDREWSHLLVRHPSGLLLDITGAYTDEEIVHNWYGHAGDEGITFTANELEHLANAGPPTFNNSSSIVDRVAKHVIQQAQEKLN